MKIQCRGAAVFLGAALFAVHGARGAAPDSIGAGESFEWGGRKVVVKRIDGLPLVENEYSRRFRFDSVKNPKLRELRTRYRLDEVIAPGKDEFEKQVLLMDWVHHRFPKFGAPSSGARGALEILSGIEEGETYFCTHFAHLLVSSAASVGWVNRELALRRHQGTAQGGSTEHATTEIWSNQHGKWIMLDPTSNMYLEKRGVPLNAWEIRQEWFYNDGRELVFVIGKERKEYRKSDLPILLRSFAGFGDLVVAPDELDKYGFIGYIPNTDLMDAGEDWGQMFVVKDQLCAGTKWHQRALPENPGVDPYFPIGQAAVTLHPGRDAIEVRFGTLTPNFQRFEVRLDGGEWQRVKGRSFEWNPRSGTSLLEARTVNGFGVRGPITTVEVEVGK